MNEKINELVLEATKDMPETYYWPGQYVEKFAELIVRECYQVCKNNLVPLSEYDSDEAFKYNEGVSDCAILIKRRFGVE